METLYGWDSKAVIAAMLALFIIAAYTIRPMLEKPAFIRTMDYTTIACAALLGLIVYLRILELTEYWG
ncbi:hypothetical protein [Methanoculleus sediminis]|nr:hypothetical protein [Methanoculleus sediminis]